MAFELGNNVNLTKNLLYQCVGAPWEKYLVKHLYYTLFMIIPIQPCQFGARKNDNSVLQVLEAYS